MLNSVAPTSVPSNVRAGQYTLSDREAAHNQSVGICQVDGKSYLKVDGIPIQTLSDFQKTSLTKPEHFLDHPLVKEYLDSFQVETQQDDQDKPIKVMSWNVNLCRSRLEDSNGLAHQTHPHYRMENRKVFVWQILALVVKLHNPDIICLQEIRDFFAVKILEFRT